MSTSDAKGQLQSIVEEGTTYLRKTVPAFIESLEPTRRIRWDPRPCTGSVDERFNWVGKCYIYVDGNRVKVFDGIGDKENGMSSEYFMEHVTPHLTSAQALQDEAILTIRQPLEAAMEKWLEAVSKTKKEVVL